MFTSTTVRSPEMPEPRQLSFGKFENQALRPEAQSDPSVILLGEDVAGAAGRAEQGLVDGWGGIYGTGKGLIQEFGPRRVIDTPICEQSFLGAAAGGALAEL